MLGDSRLVEETSKAFKKDKKLVKGIAFPTCISVNNCICHFSPMNSDPDVTLKVGLIPRFKRYRNIFLAGSGVRASADASLKEKRNAQRGSD